MPYYMDEIRKRTGYSSRTLNNWIRHGVLPKAKFKGAKTAYGDEHLYGLLAIRALHAQRKGIAGIKSFFRRATAAAIRRVAGVAPAVTPHAATGAAGGDAAASVARWTHVA